MNPLSLTERLVSEDSVSARPNRAVCERIADAVAPLGGVVRWLPKPGDDRHVNLLVRFGPDRPGGLALAGHADTVPWDASMRATTTPERSGDRLYGRGTCDMKGAIAAMVCAAAGVDKRRLKAPLWLAFTFEEEIGCHGAKHLAAVAPLGVERCIIGEPTGLRPVTLHKGYVIAEAKLRGTPCHSSDPDAGASAVHAASRAVDAVLERGKAWRVGLPETPLVPPYPTVNVGLLAGGTARNVVPETASFTIEMRPMPGSSPEAMLDELEADVRAAAATVPGVSTEFLRHEIDQPFGTSPNGPLTAWLREHTGSDVASVPFYTEAAFFQAMGAEVCVCGPGEIAQAHRVDEWVAFDALGAAEVLYRQAIEEFCT